MRSLPGPRLPLVLAGRSRPLNALSAFCVALLAAVTAGGALPNKAHAIDPEKGVRLKIGVQARGILGMINAREAEWAGTKGQSRPLMAFQVAIDEPIDGLGIKYRLHVGHIGDTDFAENGAPLTYSGKQTIQGISIELTGPAASKFTVLYQAHLGNKGDTEVYADGQFCGTRGESRDIQSLVIVVKQK